MATIQSYPMVVKRCLGVKIELSLRMRLACYAKGLIMLDIARFRAPVDDNAFILTPLCSCAIVFSPCTQCVQSVKAKSIEKDMIEPNRGDQSIVTRGVILLGRTSLTCAGQT